MTPQELKNSILQFAIQGKLVEQRPEEGTAEELYRQIQSEKQRLIKAGTIKKEKPLPEITEDEKPFEIPEGWMWVRVSDCVSNQAGLAYKKEYLGAKSSNMIRVLRGGNIFDMHYALKPDDVIISSDFVKPELLLRKNTIITPAVTSLEHIGKMGRIEKNYNDTVVGGFVLMLLPHFSNEWFSKYLLYVFSSRYFRDCCRGIVNKSGQAFYNLSREKMMQLCIPIPPLAEQTRIVAKIEELLPYIDSYEKAWSKLEDFNKRFPVDMQKSILQMAIQGKLVKQRPEEGTGEELYQKIQVEKQRLIKAGTIKKEKPLPEITECEKPFEIPESWMWVRLSSIGLTQTGNTPSKAHPEYTGKDVPFITPGDILNGDIAYDNQALSTLGKIVARVCCAGTVLQVCIGGSIGKAAITNREVTFNQQINSVFPIFCDSKYIFAIITSQYFIVNMKESAGGTATPIINKGIWDTLLIPLPPLAEQKRIVAKQNEILPLCEKLK